MRVAKRIAIGIIAVAAAVLLAWSVAIGPVAVWRVLTHGTTTVWDHLDYPGRDLEASSDARPWPHTPVPLALSVVEVDGQQKDLEELFGETSTLGFIVIDNGNLAYEWYATDHGPDRTSMVFSVSKSILSLLIGAAIDDGIIGSVNDPVTAFIPEMASAGFDDVTLEDLLRMDSNLAYIEGDNPFGLHVEFNYTADLTGRIVALKLGDEADVEFRYKSGDNAILGLVLDRALEGTSITEYLRERLWDPINAETGGTWSTDHNDGLERTWCCLAVTARDLARLGQLVLQNGEWSGRQIVSEDWLRASFESGYPPDRWPSDYRDSPLSGYGYQWWLTDQGAYLAFGKDGQYLYIDPAHEMVVVRLGESQGDLSWLGILEQVADATGRDE